MNTSQCPTGWASDEIFICNTNYPNNKPPCQAPIAAYAAIMSAFIAVRILIVARQFHVWNAREILRRRNNTTVAGAASLRKTRYPVVVLNGILTVVIFIIFIVLTCLDLASCRNGGTGPLLYIYFLPLTLSALLYITRLTRLGRTLIPLSKAQLQISPQQESLLTKPDTILAILTGLGKTSWIVQFAALLIASPVLPGNYLPVAIGVGSYGVMDYILCLACCWQLNRLITVASGALNRDADNGAINSAIKLLRNQQLYTMVSGYIYGTLWVLLAVQVIPFTWYMVIILLASETISALFFTLRFRAAATSGKTSNSSSKGQKNTHSSTTSRNMDQTATGGEKTMVAASGAGGGGSTVG